MLKAREYQGEKVEILLQRNWADDNQDEDGVDDPGAKQVIFE